VSAGKRRTPGLRREEVAVLAGIGTSWYTWLEQGRDIKVSEPIARAIGRALRLDQGELAYFYRLVGLGHSAPVADIADSVFEPVVNGWLPNPALVIDPLWNILAANWSMRLVFGLSPDDENLLTALFSNTVLRARVVDWDRTTRATVARFRAATVEQQEDPALHTLVEDLESRSNHFTDLWRRHEVMPAESTPVGVDHPEVGQLDFEWNTWQRGGTASVQLVLYLPRQPGGTADRLGTLLHLHPRPAIVSEVARSSADAC
jgi:hypothetical protein